MTELNIKKIVEELIDTFYYAGKISLDLREKGLIKETKSEESSPEKEPKVEDEPKEEKPVEKKIEEVETKS